MLQYCKWPLVGTVTAKGAALLPVFQKTTKAFILWLVSAVVFVEVANSLSVGF